MRFGELKRDVAGISSRVLTERLRKLEDAGLVHRDYQSTIPPQVSYSLTPRGAELRDILNELSEVAQKWGMAGPCETAPLQKTG
ncbi:MAG: helix-turn-helix transcriptional regulator [Rhodobacteraceae bacterium]|nr:helix-turn-helix transcriptional regulator [Paracoccaceae bacterium]